MEYKSVFKSDTGKAAVLEIYDKALVRWRVPYETLQLATAYGDTFIIKSGSVLKPPLVLLHGTSSNSVMWLDDVEEFSKYFCVYAADIPGEPGKSEERQYPLKGGVYFYWLEEVLKGLKLDKATLAGISLGAWLAAGFACRNPEKVEKLVLLCPSGIGRQRISFLFKAMPLMLLGDWGYARVGRWMNGSRSIPAEVEEYTRLISGNFNLRTEPVPVYTDNELIRLTMPVQLFAGEKDILLNSKETVSRISALLPHAQVNMLPGYGHILTGLKGKISEFLLK